VPLEVEGSPELFPRLERLCEVALRLHAGEAEEDKGKKPKKQAPSKPDKKKNIKEEDEPLLSAEEEACFEAVKTEQAIFRYRVQTIKDHTISKLKEMRLLASKLYNKLVNWSAYSL